MNSYIFIPEVLLRPSENISQIPRQVAGAPCPRPPHYVRYMQYRLFLGETGTAIFFYFVDLCRTAAVFIPRAIHHVLRVQCRFKRAYLPVGDQWLGYILARAPPSPLRTIYTVSAFFRGDGVSIFSLVDSGRIVQARGIARCYRPPPPTI